VVAAAVVNGAAVVVAVAVLVAAAVGVDVAVVPGAVVETAVPDSKNAKSPTYS